MNITDEERGARIALDIASQNIKQRPLFDDGLSVSDWLDIADAADDQITECLFLRAAVLSAT